MVDGEAVAPALLGGRHHLRAKRDRLLRSPEREVVAPALARTSDRCGLKISPESERVGGWDGDAATGGRSQRLREVRDRLSGGGGSCRGGHGRVRGCPRVS